MIAILSDVHGNYPALMAVLKEVDAMGCKIVISLGDVAGYYCMINQCVDALRSRKVIHLMGNHDDYLVSGSRFQRSKSANRCLDYQEQKIAKDNLMWLAVSPVQLNFQDLSLVHGGWNDPLDEYLYELDENYFVGMSGEFFASGHTHIQTVRSLGGITYCNPGSVGQPRDGNPMAAFAVFDDGEFKAKRVAYDISLIASEMDNAGFDSYFYQNLYTGSRIGGDNNASG